MPASFQDYLDNLAKLIGGNQPDAVNRPRWFSGDQVPDTSGLQVPYGPSFKGCYSAPVEMIEDYPTGLILPGPFEVGGPQNRDVYYQGKEYNVDDLRLLILFGRIDAETDFPNMTPFRDLVPAALAAHMTANDTAGTELQGMVRGGKPVVFRWNGSVIYNALEFNVRLIRMINRTYVQ